MAGEGRPEAWERRNPWFPPAAGLLVAAGTLVAIPFLARRSAEEAAGYDYPTGAAVAFLLGAGSAAWFVLRADWIQGLVPGFGGRIAAAVLVLAGVLSLAFPYFAATGLPAPRILADSWRDLRIGSAWVAVELFIMALIALVARLFRRRSPRSAARRDEAPPGPS